MSPNSGIKSFKIPNCFIFFKIVERLVWDFKISIELRDGIKTFSDWPTIPQLYIKGEFVGGCDIVKEMFESGELSAYLKDKAIPHKV